MEYHSDVDNLDEDGYTQLRFNSQSITRIPVVSEKGTCAASLPWRLIAAALGILCLIILVIAVVLGTMAMWRSNSKINSLENDSFLPRIKENHSHPTQSSLEESVDPTKPLETTGVSGIPSSSCPLNWILHEKSCYLFRTSLDTWNSSKRQCSQLSSNLLNIDSSKELEFIIRQVSSQPDYSFWIGLSRPQTEGPWLWEDGSTFSSNLLHSSTISNQKHSYPGKFISQLCMDSCVNHL